MLTGVKHWFPKLSYFLPDIRSTRINTRNSGERERPWSCGALAEKPHHRPCSCQLQPRALAEYTPVPALLGVRQQLSASDLKALHCLAFPLAFISIFFLSYSSVLDMLTANSLVSSRWNSIIGIISHRLVSVPNIQELLCPKCLLSKAPWQ